jgi:HPt (histidine-containing phosphotransfer) domain-containing protein
MVMGLNNTVNMSRLRHITGNDSELARDFMHLFLAQMSFDVISLEHAVKSKDHINIRRTARKMTSTLDVFGLFDSGLITREIDSCIKENFSVTRINPLLQKLKQTLDRDRTAMLKILGSS